MTARCATPSAMSESRFTGLPVPASLLGESPLWHPEEQVLYWCDIPGRQLNRFNPGNGEHRIWPMPSDPACCAAVLGGGLLLAMRDGLWRFDTASGQRQLIARPPYDAAQERFNDGKPDAQGRFWIGTIHDKREPKASLYCLDRGQLRRVVGDITNSNGLAFSPDGRTLYWADTKGHVVFAFDVDGSDGSLSRRRVFQQFEPRQDGQPLDTYLGRPDGAAVDAEGNYWVAMYEGQRLVRLTPDGQRLADLPLPVRCPTMPCFGGPDLKTLYITTARDKRPDEELMAQPLAGCVLQMRVDVPGLPAHLVQL